MKRTRRRYFNQSLARGLTILTLFSTDESWLGLSKIAERGGLSRATALRLVSTLSSMGFLERSPTTKKYRPGVAVLTLGHAALVASDIRELALPYLEELHSSLRRTVNLGVLKGAEVLYIERLKSDEILVSNVHVGSTLPAYCASMGKVLLAYLSESELRRVIRLTRFEKRGPKTITDPELLLEELARIRSAGFAVQDEELVEGLRGVAAPISDGSGRVVAAVNIAVPAAQVTRDRLEREFAPKVVATGAQVSRVAGARQLSSPIPPGPR